MDQEKSNADSDTTTAGGRTAVVVIILLLVALVTEDGRSIRCNPVEVVLSMIKLVFIGSVCESPC